MVMMVMHAVATTHVRVYLNSDTSEEDGDELNILSFPLSGTLIINSSYIKQEEEARTYKMFWKNEEFQANLLAELRCVLLLESHG